MLSDVGLGPYSWIWNTLGALKACIRHPERLGILKKKVVIEII
jgi:hypothetical protein